VTTALATPSSPQSDPQTDLAFDETFQKLLDASNLVQRLREIDAEPRARIEAQSSLFSARIDASKARSNCR